MMPIKAMRLRQNAVSGGDPFWANVSALLHFQGPNGSTTFTDERPNTWTAFNDAQISTAQFKFGTSSGAWDGSGDYISTPFSTALDISNGDFTYEAFIRPNLGADGNIGSQRNSGANGWALEARGDGAVWLRAMINGSYSDLRITTPPGVLTSAIWQHVALTRAGNIFTIWVNGVSSATLTSGGALDNNGGAPLRIGRSQANSENDYNGFMDEFRLTKGVARYTSSFTPPVAPFPNS